MPIRMRSLISYARAISTSCNCFRPILPSDFPRPILEMSPQFQFLTAQSDPVFNEKTMPSLLAEVLRCHAYFDETVFLNTIKILSENKTAGGRSDGIRLAKIRYIATVFHSIRDDSLRKTLKNLADNVEKCNVPMLRNEQNIFCSSMEPSAKLPTFTKCMHKNDLLLCYFRRELKSKNWINIKELLTVYPTFLPLYDHIDAFIAVAEQNEVLNIFMKFAQTNNPYFMELADFKNVLSKVLKSCSMGTSEISYDTINAKKSYITVQESTLLKRRIDEIVRNSKEGYVKTKEYEKIGSKVREWKKKKKLSDGRNVVVVDALNFGFGRDPKEWRSISNQFQHVVFATRSPPLPVREKVMKRYDGNALFCDKLSADDLIILRMALEFGPQTSLVTNDQYRDHRQEACNGDPVLQKIWDDFLIDAVYRHKDSCIEPRRNFNLRIRESNGHWFIPVLDSEGNSKMIRGLKVFCTGTTV